MTSAGLTMVMMRRGEQEDGEDKQATACKLLAGGRNNKAAAGLRCRAHI